MHIDGHALALLLGIGVLSYLLGHLCGQMQFPDSPRNSELPQKENSVEDPSEKLRGAWSDITGRFCCHLYWAGSSHMRIAGFFVSTEPTRPESHDRYRDG